MSSVISCLPHRRLLIWGKGTCSPRLYYSSTKQTLFHKTLGLNRRPLSSSSSISEMLDNQNQLESQPQVATTQTFAGVRMSLRSTQSFAKTHLKILAALNSVDYKPGEFLCEGGPIVMRKDTAALEEFISRKAGAQGFVLFDVLIHSRWLTAYNPSSPHIATYVFGSPIKAKPLLERYPDVGLSMPLRLNLHSLTPANSDVDGCSLSWDLPSSLMAIGALEESVEREVKEIAAVIDAQVEALVREVIGN